MKKIWTIIIVITILFTLGSCKKEDLDEYTEVPYWTTDMNTYYEDLVKVHQGETEMLRRTDLLLWQDGTIKQVMIPTLKSENYTFDHVMVGTANCQYFYTWNDAEEESTDSTSEFDYETGIIITLFKSPKSFLLNVESYELSTAEDVVYYDGEYNGTPSEKEYWFINYTLNEVDGHLLAVEIPKERSIDTEEELFELFSFDLYTVDETGVHLITTAE